MRKRLSDMREGLERMTPVEGIKIIALRDLPMFRAGMSIAREIASALERAGDRLHAGDVCVVAQKIVSKVEGRQVGLASVEPGAEATRIARETERDPRILELILAESSEILRATQAAIIARHRTGHVLANAGIDGSNVEGAEGENVLLWPEDPDASARKIRAELGGLAQVRPGVLIADSMGRAWRIGTVGTAIGCAGLQVLEDRRGVGKDLFGRTLQATVIAVADALAAAACLVMGEGDEGTPVVIIRGAGQWLSDEDGPGAASNLRPVAEDMFR